MAEYLSEFVTNLAMPPAVRPVPHQFAMGDNNAYTFTALLCDARNPNAELMAGTVSGSLLRPDGTTVALGGTKGAAVRRVNLDGGGMCNATPCSVTLPQACFAYPGRVTLVITLVDGTTITQALAVSAVVARTSTDAVVDPGDLVPDVDELQAIATELTAAVGGAVRFDEAQTLTDAQKAQARANIGAGEGGGGTVTGAVRYDTAQTLTDAEKTQALTNVGAAAVSAITSLSADITALETQKAVRYDTTQFLTDAQKAQARTNTGAAGAAETTAAIQTEATARDQAIADKAVRYDTAQSLTDAQKIQARGNIGAADAVELDALATKTVMGLTWAQGTINGTTGQNGSAVSNRIRTNSYYRIAEDSVVVFGLQAGYEATLRDYAADGTFVGSLPSERWGENKERFVIQAGHFLRFVARKTDDANLEPADGANVTVTLLYGISGNSVAVAGTTPSITALPGAAYNCIGTGTAASPVAVTELAFTPSSTGICSVRFVSGTTATVLTLPNTVKMPDWWTGTEANRTYEIKVTDGAYADVSVWADSDKNLEIAKALGPVMLTGAFTSSGSSYGTIGTTDARLYVYPFGLAIAKFHFRINSNPGTTARTLGTVSVKPIHQIGMTITSQEGTYCALYIDASGNVMVNSKAADANGTYHVVVTYPITPYIPST